MTTATAISRVKPKHVREVRTSFGAKFVAFKIEGIPDNYPELGMSSQDEYKEALVKFRDTAKRHWVGCKRKSYRAALLADLKLLEAEQVYVIRAPETAMYKDDCFEILYK